MPTFLFRKHLPVRDRLAGHILLMKKHGDRHYAALRHDNLPHNVRINAATPLPPGLLLDSGWQGVIDGRLWSGTEPVLKFWLSEEQKTQRIRMRMLAGTFGPQPFDVILNGAQIATLQDKGGAPHLIEINLPPSPDVNVPTKPGELREYNILKFVLPKTRSKKTAGQGEDDRRLGIGVNWFEFVAN